MKKRFYLAAASVLLAQPALAGAREDVLAAMQRCSVMQDDRTWLECTYGAQQIMRAKLGLTPAPDYQQRLVPPRLAARIRRASANRIRIAACIHRWPADDGCIRAAAAPPWQFHANSGRHRTTGGGISACLGAI